MFFQIVILLQPKISLTNLKNCTKLDVKTRTPLLEVISPIPSPSGIKSDKSKAQTSKVLTDSPHKNLLLANKQKQKKGQKRQGKKLNFGKTNKRTSMPTAADEVEVEINVNDWTCMLCGESVLADMVRCHKCEKWAHESCADYSAECGSNYVCDFCTK